MATEKQLRAAAAGLVGLAGVQVVIGAAQRTPDERFGANWWFISVLALLGVAVVLGIASVVQPILARHRFPDVEVEVLRTGYEGSRLVRDLRLMALSDQHSDLTVRLSGMPSLLTGRGVDRRECPEDGQPTRIKLDHYRDAWSGSLFFQTQFDLLDAVIWNLDITDQLTGKSVAVPGDKLGTYTPAPKFRALGRRGRAAP